MTVAAIRGRHFGRAIEVIQRGTRTHYVYFIKAVPHHGVADAEPCVKIGTTTDVDHRLSSIRKRAFNCPTWLEDTANAQRIDVIGYVVGDQELEKELHRAFADYRISGEWFALEPISHVVNLLLHDHCVCRGCQAGGRSHAYL